MRRSLLALVFALVGTACQLRTDLNLTVEPDGSGQVEVAIGLDEDGVARNPGLLDDLDVADLVAAGWTVSGPTVEDDGFTRVRIRHSFAAPEEVAGLFDEIGGDGGPFRDFSVVRDDAFAETRYRFDGVVDFTDGVDGLAEDPELSQALGADPVALVEERLGTTVDEVLRFQVAVRLPGEVTSNAPTQASNGAVWRPSVLEHQAVELSASSTIRRTGRLVWAAVAGLAGFGLLLFVLVRFVAWRRARSAPGSS